MADNYTFKDAGGNTITHASTDVGSGVQATRHVDVDEANVAIAKAEDAAHSSGDKGYMLLAVRKDTAAALAGTDGDYIPLIVDASGKLHVIDSSLQALLPASLGQKSRAASMPVTLASDESGIVAGSTAIAASSQGRIIAGIRNDSNANLTDANYDASLISVDSTGRLKTYLDATAAADAAAAAGPLFRIAGKYQSSPTELSNGQLGDINVSPRRAMMTVLDKSTISDVTWTDAQVNAATRQEVGLGFRSSICGYIVNSVGTTITVYVGYYWMLNAPYLCIDSWTMINGQAMIFGPGAAGAGASANYRSIPALALWPDSSIVFIVTGSGASGGSVLLRLRVA